MLLLKCRKKAGLRQKDIATEVGVDRSTVAKWETSGVLPRADKLIRLAQILGVTVDELLRDETKEGFD